MTKDEEKLNEAEKAAQEKMLEAKHYIERKVLAAMLYHPQESYPKVLQLGLQGRDFTDVGMGETFAALLEIGDEDLGVFKRRELAIATNRSIESTCDSLANYEDEPPTLEEMAFLRRVGAVSAFRRRARDILFDINGDITGKVESLQREVDILRTATDAIAAALDGAIDGDEPDVDDIYTTPEKLTHVPGLIGMIMDIMLATAPRPNRVLALAGALAFMAHLMGRRYVDTHSSRPNLYVLALADTGVGKQYPRVVIKQLAMKLGISKSVREDISTGQGVEDAVLRCPATMFLVDEVDTLFNQLKVAGNKTEGMYKALLSFATDNSASYTRRTLADSSRANSSVPEMVMCPSVSLLGNGIPDKFYRSLTERALTNGLASRCLVLEAGKRGEFNENAGDVHIQQTILDLLQVIVNKNRDRPNDIEPDLFKPVEDGPGVKEEIASIRKHSDQQYDLSVSRKDSIGKAIWTRTLELVRKLALIYAVSENLAEPKISLAGVRWAWELYKKSTERLLVMANRYLYMDEEEETTQLMLDFIKGAKSKGVNHSAVSRALHLSKDKTVKHIETLIARDEVVPFKGQKGGTIYRATKYVKKERQA